VEISPAFSPDGKRVAFVWEGQQMDNMDVYVKEIGSETSLRLTTDSRPEFNPVWSPDGGSIAFMRTAMKSTDEIYIVSLYGGAERKVAEISTPRSDTPEPYLAWSRDGRWLIVPERQSALEPFGLTMISLESGQTRKLTVAPAQSLGDSAPAVSRDGRTLAFVRCKSVRVCDIWLLDLMPSGTPAGSPRRLTTEGAGITSPVWMPNGQEILYIRSQGEIASLWRVAATGGLPPAIVNAVGNPGQEVDISPQGDKLVTAPVTADRNLYRIELSDAGAAVGKPQQLTTSTSSDHSPSISPDGNRLAFLSYRTGSSEIWVSRPDGTEARRLTSFNGPQTAAPRWSPDSRTIVFDARVDGNADLYTVNAEGGAVRRVTRAPANEFAPSWSWDGSWIYYTSDRTGERQIWKVPAAGGDEAQVTRKGGVGPRESVDGKWVYYAKTYSYSETSIWRASPAGGEESRVFDSAWSYFNFFPLQDGILYSHSYVEGKGYPIMYHRFSSGRHEQVLTTQHRVAIGLSAWPISKARHVYFADWEIPNGDLMLVENFR
jgi:Tol biopolymer transport system component